VSDPERWDEGATSDLAPGDRDSGGGPPARGDALHGAILRLSGGRADSVGKGLRSFWDAAQKEWP